MTESRDLEISPLLQECFLRTETACVRECCGLDAFEPEPSVIRAWAEEIGAVQTAAALREVRQLIADSEDRSAIPSSLFLNACAPDQKSRDQLLRFLRDYEAGLAD